MKGTDRRPTRLNLGVVDERLQAAKRAALRLPDVAHDPNSYLHAWYEFLVNANGFFSQLKLAATKAGHRKWIDEKLAFRDQDPLLRYIKEARDAEEHTSEKSHGIVVDFEVTTDSDIRIEMIHNTKGGWGFQLVRPDGSIHQVRVAKINYTLSEVTREGRRRGQKDSVYPPPKFHQGKPLQDGTALGVAETAIAFLEALLAEAESLTPPQDGT